MRLFVEQPLALPGSANNLNCEKVTLLFARNDFKQHSMVADFFFFFAAWGALCGSHDLLSKGFSVSNVDRNIKKGD